LAVLGIVNLFPLHFFALGFGRRSHGYLLSDSYTPKISPFSPSCFLTQNPSSTT
jgi:hypothetical protein